MLEKHFAATTCSSKESGCRLSHANRKRPFCQDRFAAIDQLTSVLLMGSIFECSYSLILAAKGSNGISFEQYGVGRMLT